MLALAEKYFYPQRDKARKFSTDQEICRILLYLDMKRACGRPDENERPHCLNETQHESCHSSLNKTVALCHIYCKDIFLVI